MHREEKAEEAAATDAPEEIRQESPANAESSGPHCFRWMCVLPAQS